MYAINGPEILWEHFRRWRLEGRESMKHLSLPSEFWEKQPSHAVASGKISDTRGSGLLLYPAEVLGTSQPEPWWFGDGCPFVLVTVYSGWSWSFYSLDIQKVSRHHQLRTCQLGSPHHPSEPCILLSKLPTSVRSQRFILWRWWTQSVQADTRR